MHYKQEQLGIKLLLVSLNYRYRRMFAKNNLGIKSERCTYVVLMTETDGFKQLPDYLLSVMIRKTTCNIKQRMNIFKVLGKRLKKEFNNNLL